MVDKKIFDGVPCCYCGSKPMILRYEADLYYVECSNPGCKKHTPYSCVGFRPEGAKTQWEYENRPIKRYSFATKKKKKNENNNI